MSIKGFEGLVFSNHHTVPGTNMLFAFYFGHNGIYLKSEEIDILV